ncbi:hypothetical protein B0H66DRAFT_91231 [Apodospora peruviana]|uniref:Uncharacterized protein n=1 Tax=Apodospora peruviana TaxID=516989 RepID=A0AAE0IUF5_9PEZI|nr:hypothetical protein B0H66DRAFT_91231 [Apodospora peruviana]
MANVGNFNRPPVPQLKLSRLGKHRRTGSNSSGTSSRASSSSMSEDQFAFSAGNTPSGEYPPSPGATRSITSTPRDHLLFGKEVKSRSPATREISQSIDSSRPTSASRPIAIEPPTTRRLSIAPSHTPPEPLSARGDLPGGYFPFHEDPASRVRPTHPFHLDVSNARRQSLHQAAESESLMSSSVAGSRPPTNMSGSSHSSFAGSAGSVLSGSHTPVSSYIPNGVHDHAALPMGKYYPSNYENRSNTNSQQHLRPGPKLPAPGIVSEPQIPRLRRENSHARTGSDVRRRILQYQRDMIAQATMAASALLEKSGSGTSGGSSATAAASALGGLGVKSIQLGGTMLKTHRPLSPRLAPLGSPGPVTPMDLEGNDGDSYMTLGRPMTGPDAERQAAEVSRAIQVEQTRQYRTGNHSPAPELHHAVSF